MAIAAYQDLCIDVTDAARGERFWSRALGLTVARSGPIARLDGPTPQHRVWLNLVPEPKTVKNRVHLDLHTSSIEELTDVGAALVPTDVDLGWVLMTDPDGGELDAFVRAEPPEYRLYEVAVDAAEPLGIATWWANVYGGELHEDGDDDSTWWYVDRIPGCPFECFTFNEVPEPKTAKNRVHWDVTADALEPLLDAGATVLRPRDEEIGWSILADPEGNEFCVFLP